LPLWKPENAGEYVEGKLVSLRAGKYGQQYEIEQADGAVVTVPTSAFLENRIAQADVGKMIKIVFDGMQASKTKGKNDMRTFKIFVKK
jgi:hypothetical protein